MRACDVINTARACQHTMVAEAASVLVSSTYPPGFPAKVTGSEKGSPPMLIESPMRSTCAKHQQQTQNPALLAQRSTALRKEVGDGSSCAKRDITTTYVLLVRVKWSWRLPCEMLNWRRACLHKDKRQNVYKQHSVIAEFIGKSLWARWLPPDAAAADQALLMKGYSYLSISNLQVVPEPTILYCACYAVKISSEILLRVRDNSLIAHLPPARTTCIV